MSDSISICIIIGSCLGSFTTSIVIIQLCFIKYKDLATLLIFFLMITDLIMGVLSLVIFYSDYLAWCLYVITVAVIFKQWHKFIIFFIGYSMYCVINKEKYLPLKRVMCYLTFTFAFSIFIGVINAITFNVKLEDFCYVDSDRNTVLYYVLTVWECSSELIIFVSLCFFYSKIQKVLLKDAENCNLKSARKRIFAKRLFGYCIVFSFYLIPYILWQILYKLDEINSINNLQDIIMLFFSWYPFLDSLIYGFTKSFKKNIFNCIWKSPEFDTDEETLQILREENLLRPRFYLDMIEESEINLIIK